MEIYKYLPLPSDRMGMLWTISSIEDVCIVEFGPAGTTHYAVEGVGSLNAEDKARIYSTHMDEKDIAFGHYDRLEKAIVEIDFNIKPKYVFVMASSISSIIGTDINSICDMMQSQVTAKLVSINLAGFKGDYANGVEQGLELIARTMIKEPKEKYPTYNILGCNIDQYNFEADSEEIKRMMSTIFDKKVQATFTAYSSIEEIEQSSCASLNIILRKEALKVAMWMKEKYGIPYIYQKPYGLQGSIEFIEEIKNQTGWEINKLSYEREIAKIKPYLFRMKRKFYNYEKSKKCALFADRNTVLGLQRILEEVGLEVDRAQCIHEDLEGELLTGYNEIERAAYLKENELFMLLADGVTIEMPHKASSVLQVSNPNLKSVNLYPYTPYVGFRGMLWIIHHILHVN